MKGTFNGFQRLISLMLALVLVFGLMPAYTGFTVKGATSAGSMVADDSTADSYKDMLGELTTEGNRYAGRIWTDKSVYEGTGSINLDNITDIVYDADEFLTVYSTLGSTTSVTTETVISGNMDIVVVIDNSMSMSDTASGTSSTRQKLVVDAANDLIYELLAETTNRLAVVTYEADATTILPLNHYNQTGSCLTISSSGSSGNSGGRFPDQGSSSNNKGVITASATIYGTTTSAGTSDSGFYASTNQQAGINEAMSILYSAGSEGRIPVVIVLSDGVADTSTATNMIGDVSDVSTVHPGNNTLYTGVALSTLLNAAYWKYMVGQKYGTDTTVFTVGVDIPTNEAADAKVTMDPANGFKSTDTTTVGQTAYAWYESWATSTVAVGQVAYQNTKDGSTWYFHQPDSATKEGIENNIYYVDEYFPVSSTELSTAFDSILTKISSTQSAFQAITDMDGTSPQTYVDFIGDYMQVNEFKGVTLYGKFYSVTKGTSTTVDNGDGTVTVTTKYVVESASITDPVTKETFDIRDVIDIELKHTYAVDTAGNQSSAGEQEVWIHILEEAMPLIHHDIKTENGEETYSITEELPLRVYYTVGISDYVAPAGNVLVQRIDAEYLAANTDEDGITYFYTNQHYEMNSKSSGLGDAHTAATPHEDNRYYYHQYEYPVFSAVTKNNSAITFPEGAYSVLDDGSYTVTQLTYADVAGLADADLVYTYITFHVPTGTATTANGVTTYSSYDEVQHIAFSSWEDLKSAVTFKDAAGNYYTLAEAASYTGSASSLVAVLDVGSWRMTRLHNMAVDKAEGANKTDTATVRVAPMLNADDNNVDHEGTMVAWLGNNGRLGVTIEPIKSVFKGDSTVNIDGEKVMLGDVLTYQIKVTNHEKTAADITITDTIPTGTVYVTNSASNGGTYSNGVLTWTLENVAAGETVTVTFQVNVTSAAVESIDNTANITIGNNSFESNTTVNYPEGKVAGVTENPVGTDGVQVGSVITYTIYYHNDTASAAAITITDTIPTGTTYVPGSASYSSDPSVFTYANGELTWVLHNVPADTHGSVTFQVVVNSSATTTVDNKATIQVGNDPEVTTNTTTNNMSYGDLVLTKTVADGNAAGDASKAFTLVLQAYTVIDGTASNLNGTYTATGASAASSVTFTNGQAKLTIKHGETITIEKLPAGITVTVYEENADGYTATYNTGAVIIPAGGMAQVDVTNTYYVTSASLTLSGLKTLTGRTLIAGRYRFLIKNASGTIVADAYNDAPSGTGNSAAALFDPLTYTAAGTYTYTITEENLGETGVTYATIAYTLVVTVTDDGAGKLYVSDVIINGESVYSSTSAENSTNVTLNETTTGIVFENTYTPNDLLVHLYGTKILKNLSGEDQTLSAYTFKIVDEYDNVVYGTSASSDATIENGKSGSGLITFNTIEYDLDDMTGATMDEVDGVRTYTKSFTYYVSEIKPDVAYDAYVDYDATVYTIRIDVTYNATTAQWSYEVYLVDTNEDATLISTNETAALNTNSLVFTNTHYPTKITLPIYANKTTDNFDGDAYFSISVYQGETEVAAGRVSADTTAAELVTHLTFTEAGTYTYTVKETHAGTTAHGIKYDDTVYTLVVKVTLTNGKLEIASVTVNGTAVTNNVTVSFSNVYNASGYINVTASKVLTGHAMEDGEFTFHIMDGDTVVATGNNDENGNITFGSIYYDTKDIGMIFKYTMVEEIPDGAIRQNDGTYVLNGITYDVTKHTFYVTVKDEGGGNLTIYVSDENGNALTTGVTANNNSGITFTNKYERRNGDSITIAIDKTLTGRDMRDGEFSFTMYHVATLKDGAFEYLGTPVAVGTSAYENGAYSITRYYPSTAAPGTYRYTVVEEGSSIPGVTFDSTVYYVDVTLIDDGKGSLTVSVIRVFTMENGNEVDLDISGTWDLDFVNDYEPTPVVYTPVVYKTLNGRDIRAGEFSFNIVQIDENGKAVTGGTNETVLVTAGADGKAVLLNMPTLRYEEKGTYIYVISEKTGNASGVTYNVNSTTIYLVVTVADNTTTGKLEVSAVYHSGSADGMVLTGTDVGFVNTYIPNATTVTLTANKTLAGKNLANGEFTFMLKEGNVVIAKGTNDASGKVTFWQIDSEGKFVLDNGEKIPFVLSYDKAGEYTYTVAEAVGTDARYTYDNAVYTVKVIVTDDGKGQLHASYHFYVGQTEVGALAFSNGYTPAPITLDLNDKIEFSKTVTDTAGSGYSPAGFTFSVYNLNGDKVATGTSDARGYIDFEPDLSFSAAGEYTFRIVEDASGKAGITDDSTVWMVHVSVAYDSSTGMLSIANVEAHTQGTHGGATTNKIEFVNDYDPDDVTVAIIMDKDLAGRDLKDGEFTFHLMQGSTVVAETTNAADGSVTFSLTYDKVGEYNYTVVEVIPEDAVEQENGSYVLDGVTYDTTFFEITVKVVVDPKDESRLIASVDGDGLTFKNIYKATPVRVELGAVKVLDGRTMDPGEFTFMLKEGNVVIAKGTNDASGKVTFWQIDSEGKFVLDNGEKIPFVLSYDKADEYTYSYTITEAAGEAGGVTYSDMVYTATVEIIDNGLGALEATVTYTFTDSNGKQLPIVLPMFRNTYHAEPVSVKLTALKTLLNKTLNTGDFTFTLVGNETYTVTNGDGGIVEFELKFTEAGTYTYVMSETAGEDTETMNYDDNTYAVVIVVKDDSKGNLYIESVTVEEDTITVVDGIADTGVTFVNEYNEPKPTEPAPTEPEPTEPEPTEPAPTEPAPTEPAPTEPAPTEPEPTEPAPTEPAPTEPAPTEPEPTEPEPTEPEPPKTGDETNLALFFMLGTFSFVALAVLVIGKKKFSI